MQTGRLSYPITGIVYSDGLEFEAFLQEFTAAMAEQGMQLAGLIQRSEAKPGRLKCDMYLRNLATGEIHGISDDRGPQARGCVLNTDRLLRACTVAEAQLSSQTAVLVLCKFGKTEVEGGGFRSLMAKALELSVPVLIGVPLINLLPFREFSAGLAQEIELSQIDRFTAAERLRSSNWPAGKTMTAVERIDASTVSVEEDVLMHSTGALAARSKFA